MDKTQIWMIPLQCGCIAREMLNVRLLNRIRLIRQGRKWNNDLPQETDYYKVAAKVCGMIAFWLAGMMVWYKFLLEGIL